MKITHSLVVNIQGVTHIVQPKFNRFRALANIHFIFKLSPSNFPKAYSKSLFFSFFFFFCKDEFTNEILVTPVENIYFFRFCYRFWKHFPLYCPSDKTRFHCCAVFIIIIIIFCVFFVLIWIDFWEMPQGSS